MSQHLHIAGICGTFMAGLAELAVAQGFQVTGSDQAYYPPMSTQLQRLGVRCFTGYAFDVTSLKPDAVIFGNALSRGNPLVEAVLRAKLPYYSGPAWLRQHVLSGKQVVAVSGTHGKTTVTSLLAWILYAAGLAPGYLIGGVSQHFASSAALGAGQYFVIEADEYDSAFFDKRPKFMHYRPDILLINNLEFDHADIYGDLAAIQQQFAYLLRTVPDNGCIIYPQEDANLEPVLEQTHSPVVRFGLDQGDYQLKHSSKGHWRIVAGDTALAEIRPPLVGEHNALNSLAALLAAKQCGVALEDAIIALQQFTGVKRRLEKRGEVAGVTVYDDFAHHPTAIQKTIAGLRSTLSDGRIIAVIQLASNSMRAGVHTAQLADAVSAADRVFFCAEPIDSALRKLQANSRIPCTLHSDPDALFAELLGSLKAADHVLVMSNKAFANLPTRLVEALTAQHFA